MNSSEKAASEPTSMDVGGSTPPPSSATTAGSNPLMSYFDTSDSSGDMGESDGSNCGGGGESSSDPLASGNGGDSETASSDAAAVAVEATPSIAMDEEEADNSISEPDASSRKKDMPAQGDDQSNIKDVKGGVSNDISRGEKMAENSSHDATEVTNTTAAAAVEDDQINGGVNDKESTSETGDKTVAEGNDEASPIDGTTDNSSDNNNENTTIPPNDKEGNAQDESNAQMQDGKDDDTRTLQSSQSNNNNNNNSKDSQSVEADAQSDLPNLSPNSLVEAERQAAIAAAISANSSAMSPSVAAGIAKVLALPGLVSDKVGELANQSTPSVGGGVGGGVAGAGGVGGGVGGGRAYPNTYPPPPPPPRGGGVYHQTSPTMVALPPVPPPGPSRMPMRPVRFDDVRVAFDELLLKEEQKKRMKKRVKEGEGKEGGDSRKGKIDEVKGDDDIKENAGSVEATADVGESSEKATQSSPGDEAMDDESSEEVKGKESIGAVEDGEETTTDAEANESAPAEEGAKDGESKAKSDDVKESKGDSVTDKASEAETKSTKDDDLRPKTSIPDSFLRYLLLVARVPIIVEEHKKKESQKSSSSSKDDETKQQQPKKKEKKKVPSAAIAAAKRVHEILSMARTTYELISKQQQQQHDATTSGSKRRVDATTSFFAACSGEKIETNNNDEDDTNALVDDLDAMGIDKGVPPSSPSRSSKLNGSTKGLPPPPPAPSSLISSSATTASMSTTASSSATLTASASSMASSVFSVVSKMTMSKRQSSFSETAKKFMSGSSVVGSVGSSDQQQQQQRASPSSAPSEMKRPTPQHRADYEITINNEMLGLTVENVLERTIIRTLLPDGAAKHAGAQVGSLIAKVGNVDTSNLTHFETIDELRRSTRPLKLTLRHVGGDVLRRAREEMGRLIRGHGLATSSSASSALGSGSGIDTVDDDRPWRREANGKRSRRKPGGETFDSVLNNRWPTRNSKLSVVNPSSSTSSQPMALMRSESMHQAGRNLIRILTLMIVGLGEELDSLSNDDEVRDDCCETTSQHNTQQTQQQHLSAKEVTEAIEITSKILYDYARGLSDVDEKRSSSTSGGGSGGATSTSSGGGKVQPPAGSSFYPVPPGRVQGKKAGGGPSGKGSKGQRGKKQPTNSPLLSIGDALQRTRSFLVESSSITATALRWEIIDYLCVVLDIDTEQELSEQESASSTSGVGGGGDGSGNPMNDLGAAGSMLKLIVLNCSTKEDGPDLEINVVTSTATNQNDGSDSEMSSLEDQSSRSTSNNSTSGNCFLSVVHRLAASKSTSARVSACSLGPVLWSHLDFPRQLQLRGVLTRALHDVEVIVRKSTAAVLHEIAELVFDRRAVPWLVLMCERSMTDPEPQLRAAAMTLTWHLAEHLPNAFLGDASKGSLSIRRLPPRSSPTFMDVYLLQCKLLPVANNLAEDRVASVRLSVAAQCDRLCQALGEDWFSVIIDLLQALLSDSDERVRSEAILCMPRLVESVILGTSNGQKNITVLESLLPLALKIQKDTSSLVRSSLATATGELLIFLVGLGGSSCTSLNEPSSPGRSSPGQPPSSPGRGGTTNADHKKHVDDTLIPILQKLLQDSDPEVTTASLRAVTNASRSGTSRDSASTYSHTNHNMIDDDLVSLSSHQSHQSHTSYERTKPVFIPVLSESQVLRLLPTLSNLATSTQWRVRQSAVEIVPALMGCTHRHETRHEISKLCLNLMNDKVDAVRKTAAECLCLGGSSLARHGEEDGGEWIKKTVIPHLRTCSKSEDSKQRLLSLKMIEIIIANGLCPTSHVSIEASPPRPVQDDESLSSSVTEVDRPIRMILNIAASHTSDKVANVRLNVGRTFGAVMLLLDKSDVDYAVETLEKQLEEETGLPNGGDRDVIYFAQQAIAVAQPLRRLSSHTST